MTSTSQHQSIPPAPRSEANNEPGEPQPSTLHPTRGGGGISLEPKNHQLTEMDQRADDIHPVDKKPTTTDSSYLSSIPDAKKDILSSASVPPPAAPEPNEPPPSLPRSLTSSLYVSHFLSTWNSRLFEMGAVLFLASIFPNTLLQMSVYALVRSGSAIIFSPAVGAQIDRRNRLSVVRFSIIGQRFAVAASCGLFWAMEQRSAGVRGHLRSGLFAMTILLACVEKLCAVMNLVSVERDWVVVITEGDQRGRQTVNARMRRIDLFCKLLGPLVISLIDGASTMIAISVTLGMSVASVFVEYICIARVYKMVPALRRAPASTVPAAMEDAIELNAPGTPPPQPKLGIAATAWLRSTANRLLPVKSIPFYFKHQAFLPSISLSLLYLTVLSFSGQMVTFLLASGYNSIHVGIARTVSTIFELSATWIAPRIMRYIGAIRGGMWFLSWQMAWLVGGIAWYFADGEGKAGRQILAVSGLVGGVILSRVGLWGFDLCAQAIIQDAVDLDNRGAFSTVEASFQNLFELLSYVSTIVFSRPDQFQWPAVISAAAVYLAGAMYAGYVRKSRGHLLHYPACIEPRFYERRGI